MRLGLSRKDPFTQRVCGGLCAALDYSNFIYTTPNAKRKAGTECKINEKRVQ